MKPLHLLSLITILAGCLLFAGCENDTNRALRELDRNNFEFNSSEFIRAAAAGDEQIVSAFLEAGMNPASTDEQGRTALIAAAENGHTRSVELLLNQGAPVNAQDQDGWTALTHAAYGGHDEMTALLLEKGAERGIRDNKQWSPLLHAVYRGHGSVARQLIDQSSPDLNRALLLAAFTGQRGLVERLLEHGANPDFATDKGNTTLMIAARGGHDETARTLLAAGADPNLGNRAGETAQLIAMDNGHPEIAALIEKVSREGLAAAGIEPQPQPAKKAETPEKERVAEKEAISPEEPEKTAATDDVVPEPGLPEGPATGGAEAGISPLLAEEKWFTEHGIDPAEEGVLDLDLDNDGFSNRDEYLADTDPRDPRDRPSTAARLRLVETEGNGVPYALESVEGRTAVLRSTANGKILRASSGERLPGTRFLIERVRERRIDSKEGLNINASEATLTHIDTGRSSLLVVGQEARTAGDVARISYRGQTMRVERGGTFQLPDDPEVTYEVVDVRPTQVVARNRATAEVLTITPQETIISR